MAIDTGVEAPDFTLKTQDDKEWKLSSHRGKNIVLLFYPLDWSPTCEKENCKISNEPIFSDFKNTVVVGISRDSTWSHKAWKEAKGIKHDLLADPKLEVAKLYDLVHPAGFISHRATVVINKGFNVEHVQVQEKTPEARDLEAIRGVLKSIA
jgi:peroxiredoxin